MVYRVVLLVLMDGAPERFRGGLSRGETCIAAQLELLLSDMIGSNNGPTEHNKGAMSELLLFVCFAEVANEQQVQD